MSDDKKPLDQAIRQPKPAAHSDNKKSAMPERDDATQRPLAPNDKPGAEKSETPVG